MALAWPNHILFRSSTNCVILSDLTESRSAETLWPISSTLVHRRNISLLSTATLTAKTLTPSLGCFSKSTEDKQWTEAETIVSDSDTGSREEENETSSQISVSTNGRVDSQSRRTATTAFGDSVSLGIREPVYEVVEVKSNGALSTKKINRRQLLKMSGLRPRDIRSVDPSLFLTNSMPSLLHIVLHLFISISKGGKAFLETLLPRLNPKNSNGGPSMPFELEVVEAALLSRTQRLEQRLMDLEPRVQALLEVLPNRLTGDILEQLRISKQTLVELGSRAGALRQMLLDLLEDPHEIRRICIMGSNCTLKRGSDVVECSVPLEKQIAEEEEEEIEMLLENYLQRCESCHGQAERLLDSAREMEDSIAVNLSSRRLEVSRVELLLQVGTFCVAVGALVAGIFGMNLKSYLEEHVFAFWLTTAGIIVGAVITFFLMYYYLKARKIL
ncbi:magnesium transporter MRS2-11, chloroplastic-like [Prosopis cineraria]|uniref:magnesium transporter MRS2-11, chloroplastic-like n=1 Tax=Prosopis cineraria TaxID=364024 RepID=UPI00240FE450|nr:magnesium transporter MRS2-11, chloroplastic-like [Prosopis cineraria]